MKRLIIISLFLLTAFTECDAQERIDALMNRDMNSNRHGQTLRMAVKRDPTTGEVIKRVKELAAIDDRELAREFIAAFEAERDNADVWEEESNGNIYIATAIWQNPKRIYTLSVNDSIISVHIQTIYREEEQ